MRSRTLSVVIPTYQRPGWLRRAVASLAAQAPPPDEVVLVAREDDAPTLAAVEELAGAGLPFRIVRGTVSVPGFLPPVIEGFRLADADVVAVMDDDAEAVQGWVRRLLSHYDDPAVGGVGGRCVNMAGEREAAVPTTSRVGYVSWNGRFVGDMYKRPTFVDPVAVDFMMGGCMSFRRSVVQSLVPDLVLNENVAFGYEVDLGLQARNAGWRLVFDPMAAIRHHSAPRAIAGMREVSESGAVEAYARNEVRIIARRLPPARKAVALAWSFLVGERRAPGLLPWLAGPLARALGFEVRVARAALRGRASAVARVLRERRTTPSP